MPLFFPPFFLPGSHFRNVRTMAHSVVVAVLVAVLLFASLSSAAESATRGRAGAEVPSDPSTVPFGRLGSADRTLRQENSYTNTESNTNSVNTVSDTNTVSNTNSVNTVSNTNTNSYSNSVSDSTAGSSSTGTGGDGGNTGDGTPTFGISFAVLLIVFLIGGAIGAFVLSKASSAGRISWGIVLFIAYLISMSLCAYITSVLAKAVKDTSALSAKDFHGVPEFVGRWLADLVNKILAPISKEFVDLYHYGVAITLLMALVLVLILVAFAFDCFARFRVAQALRYALWVVLVVLQLPTTIMCLVPAGLLAAACSTVDCPDSLLIFLVPGAICAALLCITGAIAHSARIRNTEDDVIPYQRVSVSYNEGAAPPTYTIQAPVGAATQTPYHYP